jgi:uncharacterized membrane protein
MAKRILARRRSRWLQPIASRPHLVAAILFGVFLFFFAHFWAARPITRILIGWDGGVLMFLTLATLFMRGADHECMKRRAIEHDEGRHLMLILTTLAAIASVGALVAELSAAKGNPGGDLRIGLAAGTVILSWLFVQIVFAMHYAHVYYLAEESGTHQGGLEFGDYEEPDYWDFVHFAIVLGATAQTADIVIRSKEMRRVGTLHTLVAFGFNTAILATMINLAANLF